MSICRVESVGSLVSVPASLSSQRPLQCLQASPRSSPELLTCLLALLFFSLCLLDDPEYHVPAGRDEEGERQRYRAREAGPSEAHEGVGAREVEEHVALHLEGGGGVEERVGGLESCVEGG